MDLESATDQVYAATPEGFMAVRTALVAQARRAKDRELAKAIGALRKPTRSAWLINLLARSAADEVAAWLDLGDALREAQASLSGPELRRLSGERQQAIRGLARRAGSLAAEHGHRMTDAQVQEVSQHLQAALADPDLAKDVRAGRVTLIVTVGGFGPWEAGTAAPSPTISTGAEKGSAAHETAAGPSTAGTAPAAAEVPSGPTAAEVRAARETWEQTQAALRDAEAEAAAAVEAAQSAAAEAERLRTDLAAAERAAAEADVRRSEAEERLAAARDRADQASHGLEGLLE